MKVAGVPVAVGLVTLCGTETYPVEDGLADEAGTPGAEVSSPEREMVE